MAEYLPARKYIRVWVMRRRNNPRKGGKIPTTSYTLQWEIYGKKSVMSLGRGATLAFAKRVAAEKEKELNDNVPSDPLLPIAWHDFQKKYLITFYPGFDEPPGKRKVARLKWSKSFATMRSERLALSNFERLVRPGWLHDITTADREAFIIRRLAEVPSAASVDADLRVLRAVFNVAEDWKHRAEGSNPFAGRGKATVGARRRRSKGRPADQETRHYTIDQIRTILRQADNEATDWNARRLRALTYFVAYTGCRINEAVHLEWNDIDFTQGVAWLYFKTENDLKTEGSQAPFGLPDKLVGVLRQWQEEKTCTWVFPNTQKQPWKSGGPGYRPFDQLRALAKRAGVENANWKRFRHSLVTHGKGRFRMTTEQVRAQLRHTSVETQRHYSHDDLSNLRQAVKSIDFDM